MKFIELFWLFMSLLITVIFITNYENLVGKEKLLYLMALLLSSFLYSFRRYSRIRQDQTKEDHD